jgi:SPP1 family predicted phage head-tail adaptor
MPSIGSRRERITIRSFTSTGDGMGGLTVTWADYVTNLAAGGGPLEGREKYAAQAVNAQLSHRWDIRYRKDITPKMRVVWGSSTQEIVAVLPGKRRDNVTLECEEIVG